MKDRIRHSRVLRLIWLKDEQEALFVRRDQGAKSCDLLESEMFVYICQFQRPDQLSEPFSSEPDIS